jgi:hypothetical protein
MLRHFPPLCLLTAAFKSLFALPGSFSSVGACLHQGFAAWELGKPPHVSGSEVGFHMFTCFCGILQLRSAQIHFSDLLSRTVVHNLCEEGVGESNPDDCSTPEGLGASWGL